MWSERQSKGIITNHLYILNILNATLEQGTNHIASQRDSAFLDQNGSAAITSETKWYKNKKGDFVESERVEQETARLNPLVR